MTTLSFKQPSEKWWTDFAQLREELTAEDVAKLCRCLEYAGDNPPCPVHDVTGPEWDEATVKAGEDDPRTPEQIDLDQWQQEVHETRNSDRPY